MSMFVNYPQYLEKWDVALAPPRTRTMVQMEISLLSLRNLARLLLFILGGRAFVIVPKILDIHDLVWNLEDFEYGLLFSFFFINANGSAYFWA